MIMIGNKIKRIHFSIAIHVHDDNIYFVFSFYPILVDDYTLYLIGYVNLYPVIYLLNMYIIRKNDNVLYPFGF